MSCSEPERARRLDAVRTALDVHRLDALLAVGTLELPGAVSWLTGYSTIFSPAWCVVTPERCALVAVDYEYVHTHGETWLDAADVHHVADPVATIRRLLGDAAARVGVAGWETLSAPLAHALGDAFAPTPLLEQLRVRKSGEEVAALREAARLTDVGTNACVAAARAGGCTEVEAAAALEAAMRAAGLERPQPLVLGSGPRSLDVTPQPRAVPIEPGAMVLLDHGARTGGYCADVARAFVAGDPSPAQRRLLDTVHEMYVQAHALLRPGVDGREVHRAAERVAADGGYAYDGQPFTGHSIGADYHEAPLIAADVSFELLPGMVFAVEPGLYVEGVGGARIENTILVTDAQPDDLTLAPIRLW
jgi:Xaa-Pro aminopeptidase